MWPQQGQPGQSAAPGQGQGNLHPTVTFGQPGGQQATVLPTGQQTVMPQQAQVNREQVRIWNPNNLPPAPVPQQQTLDAGWGPFQPPQQPQPPQQQQGQIFPGPNGQMQMPQQQQAPQAPQAPQLPSGLSADTILDGPGIPVELRGRRFGQVMQIYSALAQNWLSQQGRQPGAAPPNQPQPPHQLQTQSLQHGQQSHTPSQEPAARWSWQNPEESIGRVVEDRVGRLVNPLLQRENANAVATARLIAAQSIPDFQSLEGDIMQTLANAPAELLSNPEVWQSTADLVRGRRQRMAFAQQAQQFGQPPVQQSGFVQAPRSVPAGQFSLPPQHTFFTEGPTPPAQFQSSTQLTSEEQRWARTMGMSDADYAAWKGGVVR